MAKRGPKSKPLSERFWKKTETVASGCIEWRGVVTASGYGYLLVGGRTGRKTSAHRVAFALTYGPIPEGMLVCHTCDNRLCVNPAHLWLGTHLENSQDAKKKGRLARKPRTIPRPPRAALTDADVAQIRAEYDAGVRCRVLAKRYGYSYHGMRGIVLRLVWKHVVP